MSPGNESATTVGAPSESGTGRAATNVAAGGPTTPGAAGVGASTAGVATARVFFALWPSDSVRAALAHATRKAARACGGRPVPEQNLHATLVFLGSVAASRLPELKTLASQVARSTAVAPLELVFDRIEHWEKPQVLVATAHASPDVAAGGVLARSLFEAMQRAGFDPDAKPFRPHVTIARKVAKVAQLPVMHAVSWACDAFALVESRTLPEGPVYSAVETFSLG
jgi:2'-5' RNA ligase